MSTATLAGTTPLDMPATERRDTVTNRQDDEAPSNWLSRTPARTRVLVFALALTGLGVLFLQITPGATVEPERPWNPTIIGLAIAFGLAEATALHVEIRKESHSLSLSAIPLMIGLLFASPITLIAAYLLGAAPVLRFVRHSDWVKTLWNSSLFVPEAALAAFIVRSFLGDELPSNAVEWLVPLGAVLAAELLSLVAVPLVIMVVDATFRPHLFADVGQSQILAALAGTFTVAVVAASVQSPLMLLYAAVPIVGVGLLLRSTGQLSHRHKDLQQLHTFTRSLANERGVRTLDTGLVELATIMRARTAGLLVTGRSGDEEPSLHVLQDDTFRDLPAAEVAAVVGDLLQASGVTQIDLTDQRPAARRLLAALDASKVVAVEVLGEVDRAGVLFVADRVGMREEFNSDELRLFISLANTLSARLTNDHLVERLEAQARHDALTGLPNRLSFEVAVTSTLAMPDRRGVVVMLDLDRFKEINDSLGHETGDRLLVEIADRLRASVRPTDVVSRFGGDEFAMLLVDPDGQYAEMSERLRGIHDLLTSKVDIDGITFEVGASLGVAEWPEHGRDSATLLHRADTAMYESKRKQLGVLWYTPELDADAPRRLDLYLSVGAALDSGEIETVFQPKVSAEDGRITGAEALVRWSHADHGLIQPDDFVPLVVQAGLIGRMTRTVARRAACAVVAARDRGISCPIAINLTPRDLLDPTLPDDIIAIWGEVGAPLSELEVEITEDSMVVDFETSISTLSRLRAVGVRVAIDDFGTGYSSMQHLHRLPIDRLKIDRSFVRQMDTDESAAAIVRASMNLASELGLMTVAEGVEDVSQLRAIQALGCSEIQGFLVSRAMPLAALLEWVDTWQATGRDVLNPSMSTAGVAD